MQTADAGAMLFVRSGADVACAVRMVNQLLARQRTPGSPGGDLLAILVDARVGSGLLDLADGAGFPANAGVRLRESVALSGIWSLCWFDLSRADLRLCPSDRRRLVLDRLLSGAQLDGTSPPPGRALSLVLTSAEARENIERLVDDLKGRYPTLAIGPDHFVHDSRQGGLARLAVATPHRAPS